MPVTHKRKHARINTRIHKVSKVKRTGFPKWLCHPERVKADNPSGDFCSDWLHDAMAPTEGKAIGPILRYLSRNHRVCQEARIELCTLYIEYCEETKRRISRLSALRMAHYSELLSRDWDDDPDDKSMVWEEGGELTSRLQSILAASPHSKTREYGQIGVRTRFIILARDKFTCQYCGRRAPEVALQVDHIIPKSKGGTNLHANLITACAPCNLGKSNVVEVCL